MMKVMVHTANNRYECDVHGINVTSGVANECGK
jgi:hypothetical protein